RLTADGYEDTVSHVALMARMNFSSDGGAPVTSVPVPGGAVEILPFGDFDPAVLERKHAAERERLEAEIKRSEGKLANDGFVSKAPAAVVQAERDKLARLQSDLAAL